MRRRNEMPTLTSRLFCARVFWGFHNYAATPQTCAANHSFIGSRFKQICPVIGSFRCVRNGIDERLLCKVTRAVVFAGPISEACSIAVRDCDAPRRIALPRSNAASTKLVRRERLIWLIRGNKSNNALLPSSGWNLAERGVRRTCLPCSSAPSGK